MPKLALPLSNFVVQGTATLTWTWSIAELAKSEEKEDKDKDKDKEKDVSSPHFCPPNSTSNRFQIKPHYSTFCEVVSLCLHFDGEREEMTFYCVLSVVAPSGNKLFPQEKLWHYKRNSNAILPLSHLSKDEYSPFLVNGNMTIYCKVDVLGPTVLSPAAQLKSLGEMCHDYESILYSGKLSDFVVAIGEKEFKVHKLVLSTRSPVFAAMFEHESSQEMKEGRVEIEDVAVEVFEIMLRFIYTGKVDKLGDKHEYAAELLAAADKYQLNTLKSICEDQLVDNFELVTEQTVSGLFLIADMHNADKLKSRCTKYIVSNYIKVMRTEGWKQLKQANRPDLMALLMDLMTITID